MPERKNKNSGENTPSQTLVAKPHYSMTESDVQKIQALRFRYQKLSLNEEIYIPIDISRSEIVRAGINVLQNLNDAQFLKAINSLEKLAKGRKKLSKK